jgi:hypothetical protein
MLSRKQERAMFVVKPLADGAEPRVFISSAAANEWAQYGAYDEWGAEVSEIHWVEKQCSREEAVAMVIAGKSEKRATVHRRMTAQEKERLKAAEIRDWERRQTGGHTLPPYSEDSAFGKLMRFFGKKNGAR